MFFTIVFGSHNIGKSLIFIRQYFENGEPADDNILKMKGVHKMDSIGWLMVNLWLLYQQKRTH
jgi:hypothetical protein